MRLYFHYCPAGFSNCYILATDSVLDTENSQSQLSGNEAKRTTPQRESAPQREAIMIDPGNMDSGILNLVEDKNLLLLGVLITHDHPHHVQGVKTIKRIYDTKVYAINPVIGEHRTNIARNGDIINLGPFKIEVISIPGHSADSAVFKIDRLLFTGDALTAGLLGSTASSYAADTQTRSLRNKIFSLAGDYTIFPGHGPPSSLEAERRFNMDLNQNKKRRRVFRVYYS